MYPALDRMFTNIRDALASTNSPCLLITRRDSCDRVRIPTPRRAGEKIRHVCSISQLLCRSQQSCTTTTSIGSCHSRAERDHAAPILLAEHFRRSHIVIRSCCVRYTPAAQREYHVLFIVGDMPS